MKAGSVLKKIIFSSGFQAGIPAILLMLFLPPLVTEYTFLTRSTGKLPGQFTYSDLNSDSVSENIYSGKGGPYYYISVKDDDLRFFDQWNLLDSISPSVSGIFFGDYDHDLIQEIYIFTFKKDSLFLNVNEMLQPFGTRMDRIFITKLAYIKGEATSSLYHAGFFDRNNDGKDERYFGVTSGFAKDPRRVYYYDLTHKTLKSSQSTGIICLEPEMSDIDGDRKPELFGFFSACGNYGVQVPFSDSSTWFMIFNEDLKFEFPPVEFPGYVNSLETKGYKNGAFSGYLLSHVPLGVDTTLLSARILMCSADGKILRHRLYSDFGFSGNVRLIITRSENNNRIFVLKDKVVELNDKLETIREIDLPFNSPYTVYQADLNGDMEKEILLYSNSEGKLVAYNEDFHKYGESNLKASEDTWKTFTYTSKAQEHKLFVQVGREGFFIELKRNKLYYLGYLSYPGIYLLFLLFIFVIKRINTFQVVEKESLKQRLVTLQLQAIKSQLDPHFTFNTLNSIASLIYLEDRELAYDYMNKFTQLLRSLINDAEMIYRSLGKELEFVTTYLELEKLRFGEKFKFEVLIGQNVSLSEQVPKLVLHTFAENAIKHGIMSRVEGGTLKISAEKNRKYLVLSVEDNGIGRKRAEGSSKSTGKGLKLTGEFYDILNQINKNPIKHLMIDLYDENNEPSGTRVEVWVPVD
jgi:two-component sensor histidine kinase